MLPKNHPLHGAGKFLLWWFASAPADHWIEFTAILDDDDPRKKDANSKVPKTKTDACPAGKLEESWDTRLATWVQARDAEGYHCYFGAAPRVVMNKTADGRYFKHTGKKEGKGSILVSPGCWCDDDGKNWKKDGDTPATFVFSSGHGQQLFFLYPEPKSVAEAEADNKELVKRYGGDDCWNYDRLLRIPGTRNVKVDFGGVESKVFCRIVHADLDCIVEGFAASAVSPADVPASDSKAILALLDYETRQIVTGGYEVASQIIPEPKLTPEGKLDRSAYDLAVMIRLAKRGLSAEQAKTLFLDPTNGISGKCRDEEARGNFENYFLTKSWPKAEAAAIAEKQSFDDFDEGIENPFMKPEDVLKVPPLKFAVQGIMPVGGYAMISGASKAGKSMAAIDLMLLLAGVPGKWLGSMEVFEPGPVCYAQAEVVIEEVKFRLNTIGASRDVAWHQYPIYPTRNIRFNLTNPKHVDFLSRFIEERKAKYLVLDPLARFHFGNENKASDMIWVTNQIEKIAKRAGLYGTFVVHHHGKPTEDGRSGVQMVRGSSALTDWGNSHVLFQKEWDEKDGTKFVKVSYELRSAAEAPPMMFKLDPVTLRHVRFSQEEDRLFTAVSLAKSNPGLDRKNLADLIAEKAKVGPRKAAALAGQALAQQKFAQVASPSGNGNGNGHPPEPAPEEVQDPMEDVPPEIGA